MDHEQRREQPPTYTGVKVSGDNVKWDAHMPVAKARQSRLPPPLIAGYRGARARQKRGI
jgi:hypothetical protein